MIFNRCAKRGITYDPKRKDDPEYIVRLVGQVIAVSLETVKIMEGMSEEFNKVLCES
jgi:predicted helicase